MAYPDPVLVISTLFFVLGAATIFWTHSQYRIPLVVRPSPWPRTKPAPPVAVIVPARDEQRNIQRCVDPLLAQDYPNYRVFVVDDRSSDRTPAILQEIQKRSARMQVVAGSEPPPGWWGKPHALSLGVKAAQSMPEIDWYCFIDADTFASPHLLSSTMLTALSQRADLLTILTDQELGSFWERVTLPVVFTALSVGFPARKVNDPSQPDAIANGQFILVRRDAYQAIGGHAAVRDQIAEDKALAEKVKHAGYRLLLADGRAVARTRMYTSLPEMWEGWTKNVFLGMQGKIGLWLLGVVIGLAAALALPAWLAAATIWYLHSGTPVAAIVLAEAILLTAGLLLFRALAAQAFHISPLYALTLPLGALLFSAIMITSAVKVLSGQGVTWKGRQYT